MKIEVTQEDIDKGVAKTCDKCPVALAVQRATGQDVLVDSHDIVVGSRVFTTPAKVRRFIYYFDDGGRVCPFSFELPYE